MITPSNLFSFLTKTLSILTTLTESFRVFVTGSAIGVYVLILYEVFPQFLFNINYSLYYFVIPVSAIASVMIVLPKFMEKGSVAPKPQAEVAETDPLLNQIIGDESQTPQATTPTQEENISTSTIGGTNAELDALLAGGPAVTDTVSGEASVTADTPAFDENRIRELIDQKFEPVEKDLTTFKKDLNKIKEDMKITKESVDTLTESFEGTLTDMKAFQAEISNPLNFMRKYFEALDLSNLSDPSLPLKQGILQSQSSQNTLNTNSQMQGIVTNSQNQSSPIPIIIQTAGSHTQPAPMQNMQPAPMQNMQPAPMQNMQPAPMQNMQPAPMQNMQPPAIVRGSEMDNLVKGTDLNNSMESVMKPLFSGSLSVANMMAIIELVGEMFEEKGDDCIDLLLEQCKLMGLKPEDEHTIYNIIDMLKNSGMSVEESISQLYRFAKIVGLNDKEADAYYARLSSQKRPHHDKRGSD
jgi:hypothetical protein